MFSSARKKLPATDYVSIVRAMFAERVSMAVGSGVTAAAVWTVYLHSGQPVFAWLTGAFLLAGAARYILMIRFSKANLTNDDADTAQIWEVWATISVVGTAVLYGLWCFISLAIVDDPFAQLASTMVSIAVLVGLTTRSFAIDRIVTLASAAVTVPLATGLLLDGSIYHAVMAVLLLPFLLSLRSLAGNIRDLLLTAVHGRQDASRLADELDMALSTMPHGLCMLDENGNIAVTNQRSLFDITNCDDQSFTGRPFSEVLVVAEQNGVISRATADYIFSEIMSGGSAKLIAGLNNGRHCEITVNTRHGHTVILMEDITERVHAAERINFMARYDGLTQLVNRSFFSERVEAQLREKPADALKSDVMMMIIDIDDFKHVNDTLGHLAGDKLLIEAAERIRNLFGEDATVCRFGGDEFTIFQTLDAGMQNAGDIATAVLKTLSSPSEISGNISKINASIGVTVSPRVGITLECLLTRADLALYQAKSDGKAQYCMFHEQMDVEYRKRQQLKSDLTEALNRDELYLLYQPIMNMTNNKVVGCEALVRWRHPELGLIPPLDFIPIAEETGQMAKISAWVLKTAALQCAQWPEHMSISVNLSATDFREADVEKMIVDAIEISSLAPRRLTVEITETTIIQELQGAIAALSAVRKKGVGVSLDDFGTGYSSLSYLHSLPFTNLKIDRSFVKDVVESERSQRLLSNIARLSKDLEMSVTVEGIETQDQLTIIAEKADVDFAQGYLFGAPLPQKDINELINRTTGSSNQPRPDKAAIAM